MNTFIFNADKGEIWEDWTEPPEVDYRNNYERRRWEDDFKVWNRRPHYPVSKELQQRWNDGQKVEKGKDFLLAEFCSPVPGSGFREVWGEIAIPK